MFVCFIFFVFTCWDEFEFETLLLKWFKILTAIWLISIFHRWSNITKSHIYESYLFAIVAVLLAASKTGNLSITTFILCWIVWKSLWIVTTALVFGSDSFSNLVCTKVTSVDSFALKMIGHDNESFDKYQTCCSTSMDPYRWWLSRL